MTKRYWGLANAGKEGKVRVSLYEAVLRKVKACSLHLGGGGGAGMSFFFLNP